MTLCRLRFKVITEAVKRETWWLLRIIPLYSRDTILVVGLE